MRALLTRTSLDQWRYINLVCALCVLLLRFAWEMWPSFAKCVISWTACMMWVGILVAIAWVNDEFVLPRLAIAAGMMSNCIVTLANGGFMPVIRPSVKVWGIWILATPHSRLLFLADRLPGNTSVGDWMIYAGVGINLALALYMAVRASFTPSPVLTASQVVGVAVER